MKDVTSKICTKYFQLLNAALDVPVFRDYVPNELKGNAYVLISGVANADVSTFSTSDTDTSVQVGIYTKQLVSNSSVTADDIAAIVFQTIYPSPGATVDLMPDFNAATIFLVNDIKPDVIATDSEIFINRIITFKHISITHN